MALETYMEAVRLTPYTKQAPRILHGSLDVVLDAAIEFFGRQPHNESRRRLLKATIDLIDFERNRTMMH